MKYITHTSELMQIDDQIEMIQINEYFFVGSVIMKYITEQGEKVGYTGQNVLIIYLICKINFTFKVY